MQVSDEMVRVAAEAMKQQRRDEIECGINRATYEEMAKLAITAALNAMWRPMDEAPIGTRSHDQIVVGFMGQFHWVSFVAFPNGKLTSAHGYAKPTHFMLLPSPPAGEK